MFLAVIAKTGNGTDVHRSTGRSARGGGGVEYSTAKKKNARSYSAASRMNLTGVALCHGNWMRKSTECLLVCVCVCGGAIDSRTA